MSPKTIRAAVWHRYQSLSAHERPARIADLLTDSQAVALVQAGVAPTYQWFAGQEAHDAVEVRISRLEGITNVLRKAVRGDL